MGRRAGIWTFRRGRAAEAPDHPGILQLRRGRAGLLLVPMLCVECESFSGFSRRGRKPYSELPELIRFCEDESYRWLKVQSCRHQARQVVAPVCTLLRQGVLITLKVLLRAAAPTDG